jgi:hypothetical protein
VLAAALVAYAALTNRRWLVPIAVALALPVVWSNSLAVLAAVYPLWKLDHIAGGDGEPGREVAAT